MAVFQAMKANDYTLHISDGAATPAYTKIAALTNLNMSFTKQNIDTTTKDTNGWAESLPGGGQKAISVTAEGMCRNHATHEQLKQKALDSEVNWNFQIKDEAGNTWTGSWHIASYEEGAPVNDVMTFSFELNSNGEIVYEPAV